MMKCVLVILGTALTASAALTTAPKRGAVEGNRFLFVVDASSPMDRVQHAERQIVYDLIYSGVENRMQAGDTFGIWTFGPEVKAGVFPMQIWKPVHNADLAAQAGHFLKEQSSGRRSELDVAIAQAEALAKTVKDVDFIIITSAAARFKGDETWSVLHQNWKSRLEEAKKNKKAIIITLAARGGRIVQAMLTLQGEPLQLLMPNPRQPAAVASRKTPTAAPVKVAREPIIMHGPKPRPLDQIPTQFSPPPPVEAPDSEPAPGVVPNPVPVLGPQKPVVVAPNTSQREMTVAAREPGKAGAPLAKTRVSPRLLVIVGAVLMMVAGAFGIWMVLNVRARSRPSYISQSMTDKP